MVRQSGGVLERTPDGRSWSEVGREELERMLVEQAAAARSVVAASREIDPLPGEQQAEMQGRVDTARALFFSAAAEYAMRGLPIRETAFSSGFAPLIFRKRDWEVGPDALTRGQPAPPAPGS
jgi:hypothetical protein